MIRIARMLALLSVFTLAPWAHAEDPSSIVSLTERGLHSEAMKIYLENRTEPRSLNELLAVAKSAWALGLVNEARGLWDQILANPDYDGVDRARTVLARAIMELQEGKSDDARRFAEIAANSLSPSELRGQLWLVIAESLRLQGAHSLAEGYYQKSVEESNGDSKNEALFLLAECQLRLGLLDRSRYTFASVPSQSSFGGRSIRRLMEIDLQQRNFDGVLTWATEGSQQHPQEFDDAWVHYAKVVSLVQLNRLDTAEQELKRFAARHAINEPWFVLAEATLERSFIERRYPRARLATDPSGEQTSAAKEQSGEEDDGN